MGLVLIVLSGGLFAANTLSQNRQTFKSQASSNLVNVEVVSPRDGSKALGLTQIRAISSSTLPPENLTSVLQVDGSGGEALDVASSEGKIVISGKWDSSKYAQGTHTIEVFLYDKESSPLTLLGGAKVSVTVIPP